jgi:transcriptional regulator with XRE-family HTH domain
VTDSVERNRRAQRSAYGEPLAEVFRRLMAAFDLTQAGLARQLGMSPPMLSQLISAHRVKIGNPAVLHRLQSLEELAEDVRQGRVPDEDVAARLSEIQAASGQWTRTEAHERATGDEVVVEGIRNLLRAVASGQELKAAAAALEQGHPGLAELLRVYGLGPEGPARDHFARHRDLF